MNMKRTQSTFLVQVPSSSEEGKSIKLRKDLGPLKRSEAKAIYLKSSRKIPPHEPNKYLLFNTFHVIKSDFSQPKSILQ